MISPVSPARSCSAAWLMAAQHLIRSGDEAYNLIIDIEDPITHDEKDKAVIVGLDEFLRERRANPIATVSNTIFPQDLYRRYGADELVDKYIQTYETIRRKGWGRYFERMVRWPKGDGQAIDQLQNLVGRLSKNLTDKRTYRHVFEMTLYDPLRDANRDRGRQCLSFLSFKLHPERGLMLTAMYRNHHYISRALGNFIGLGNLMGYVAEQIGIAVGPLTCVSTHAEIDTSSASADKDGHEDACRGWTLREARGLVASLADMMKVQATASPAADVCEGRDSRGKRSGKETNVKS